MKNKMLLLFRYLLSKSGILQFAWKHLPNGVYVFNYHRIGNPYKSQFDRALFSCSSQMLDQQIGEIKKNFEIINSTELHHILNEGKDFSKRYAMITFDDGYLDNYLNALPILKKHQVTGVFYIATGYIGSTHFPFWDEIAYLLRNSCGQHYQLPKSERSYALEADNIDQTIRQIIFEAKRLKGITIAEIAKHMRACFPDAYTALTLEQERLFMDWHQVKELLESGMDVGSHTINHRILSQLSDEEQQEEILKSKQVIEEQLSTTVLSIAYPVGRYHCFNNASRLLSQQGQYKFAFNNEPGKNQTIDDQYSINRICVDSDDLNRLKFNTIFS